MSVLTDSEGDGLQDMTEGLNNAERQMFCILKYSMLTVIAAHQG